MSNEKNKKDIKGSIDILVACLTEIDTYDWSF